MSRTGKAFVALLALIGGQWSCGSRTEIPPAVPCSVPGETRPCQNDCGGGLVRCQDGSWSSCEVPPTIRACENACGRGQQLCSSGTWLPCEVPPLEQVCENSCGSGVLRCEQGVWGSCEVPPQVLPCASKCGVGERTCVEDVLGPCSAPQPLPPVLGAVVRDFRREHPDMERTTGRLDPGIVAPELGLDDKPIYAGPPGGTYTVTSQESFDQWYRDVPDVNIRLEVELPLRVSETDERLSVFRDREHYLGGFFPVDAQGFGNEGWPHNYHFTLEAHGTFVYQGGETFRFTGDDDVWVFINRRLVLDMGGLHTSLSAFVDLDDVRDEIGIELGGTYELHFFFAERKTIDSNFNIETSIAGLGECP